jgi:chemotaxis protein CheZ
MARVKTQQLDDIIGSIARQREKEVTFADVLTLAENAARSLQSFFDTMDTTVYRELREIAGYIETMKEEIGDLQANEIKQNRIPAAGQELDAIVRATESATHTIMECAETVMAADIAEPAAYKALVDEKMVLVFEACSFQDITGQRIAKVIETLRHIEARVSRFANVLCVHDNRGYATEQERARAERKKRLLLHGPPPAREAIDQSEVDALIAGEPAGASAQSVIDGLFK